MTNETLTPTAITPEQLIEALPVSVSLTYVDYRDTLSEQTDVLQKCIAANTYDDLYMKIDEWYSESEAEAMHDVKNELQGDIETKYAITESEAEELIQEHREIIEDAIYCRNDSTPLKDLLRNTGELNFEYSTGIEIGEPFCMTEEERKESLNSIKKALSITSDRYNKVLESLINNASYGGELVIFFSGDMENFINYKNEIQAIKFENAHIGIIHHGNGSGDTEQLQGHNFTLPFSRENLFLEAAIHYSWAYDIAGAGTGWTDTNFTLLFDAPVTNTPKIETSCLIPHMKEEQQHEQAYKAGKCTPGDMNIKRHRNIEYINDYPCGSRCKDCGTFWID